MLAGRNRLPRDHSGQFKLDPEPFSGEFVRSSVKPPRWHWWAVGALTLLTVAVRWPSVGLLPRNWDAAQFGLAIVHYELAAHQPHPPGYPLFVAAGALLNQLIGDPLMALAWIAWLFGALTLLPAYALGRLIVGSRAALFGCLVLATSPLAWYYGTAGLTYAVEGFFATFVAWQLWRSKTQAPAGLAIAAVGLVFAGGVRPSSLLFLLPAFVWGAWGAPPRLVVSSVLILLVGSLAWFGPLVLITGGMSEYLRVNAEMGQVAASATSPLGGFGAVVSNASQAIQGLNIGLHVGLLLLLTAVFSPKGSRNAFRSARSEGSSISLEEIAILGPQLFPRTERQFLALVTLPALLFFGFVHIGQPGYYLLVLAPLCLMVGRAAEFFSVRLAVRSGQPTSTVRVILGGFLVSFGILGFWFGPSIISGRAVHQERQTWRLAQELIRERPTSETLVLTGLWAYTYFRTAELEFPQHAIHAIGQRADGTSASLYQVVDGRVSNTFSDIARLGYQWTDIPVTPMVKRVLVLDEDALAGARNTPAIASFGAPREIIVEGAPTSWVFERP